MLIYESTLTWPAVSLTLGFLYAMGCMRLLLSCPPCLPFGINNVGHSPCLSFNSIFTPCQLHLGAFHHRRSPSAKVPP